MRADRPDRGTFPFPLPDGSDESRYLRWIRNRSNYMAVRGLIDYSRAIGILLRGIAVNFLIFVPYLLLVSLAVATARFHRWPAPFFLTKHLLLLFLGWTVLFVVCTPLFRIGRLEKARLTGSDSSVQLRDWYERSFGGLLLVVLAVAAVEALPGLLTVYHDQVYVEQPGWAQLASTGALTTLLFSVAPKLLSMLRSTVGKSLLLLAIGLLGALVPLLFILFVADFLVFGSSADWTPWVVKASLVLPVGIFFALLSGAPRRSWSPREVVVLILLVAATFGVFRLFNRVDVKIDEAVKKIESRENQDEILGPLRDDEERRKAFLASDLEGLFSVKSAEKKERGLPGLYGYLEPFREHLTKPETRRGETTRETLEARIAGTEDDVWRPGELAQLGEDAGLYPEFDAVFGTIAEQVSRCKADDSCAGLAQEVQTLSAALTTVEDVTAATSPRELVEKLVSLPRTDIDRLRNEDTWEESSVLRETLDENGTLGILSHWGLRFDDARHQLVERTGAGVFWPKFGFVAMVAVLLWVFCWLTIDVNLTSVHGLYRDRLASAFLIGEDTRGDIDIEKDLDLTKLSNHDEGSTAPYHLINVALNLQGSRHIGIRDRKSDFFIFSKCFIGGQLTGYCHSETMERAFPQMDLATAMAISAAAAGPNMGRMTSPTLTAVMTLLNIRLGYWVPNPGKVEEREGGEKRKGGFTFEEVFRQEQDEIKNRWEQPETPGERGLSNYDAKAREATPTVENDLVGIGYSGGGIRSATINLGITQALHKHGVFDHVDYMSTVSGGGYLGSSISALMRRRTPPGESGPSLDKSESAGQVFRWRVRPSALICESLGKLHEKSRLVNVSDGGHIENLAAIELLRRRCRFIILGDGEGDGQHHFGGLATLIQTARLDLGIDIQINVDALRRDDVGKSGSHWALGRIDYPKEEAQCGYLLYLKSSLTDDEDEVIVNYHNKNPAFPHETTADQMFSEGQFEAYRSLGEHIAETVLAAGASPMTKSGSSFSDLRRWIEGLGSPGEARWTRAT